MRGRFDVIKIVACVAVLLFFDKGIGLIWILQILPPHIHVALCNNVNLLITFLFLQVKERE